MNKPYLGGSYEGSVDFVAEKQRQLQRYHEKAREFELRVRTHNAIWITCILGIIAAPILAIVFGNPFLMLFWVVAIPTLYVTNRLERATLKSAVLLRQLHSMISEAINHPKASLAAKKRRVLAIETNFLNNDDELYTKKSIWEAFLRYKHDKAVYYGDELCEMGACERCDGVRNQNAARILDVNNMTLANSRISRGIWDAMYIPPVCAGDKSAVANPSAYIMQQYGKIDIVPANCDTPGEVNILINGEVNNFGNIAANLPPTWMQENPLELDNDDSDFVFLNWRIKRRIRDLFFADGERTYAVLRDISNVAKESSVTFERMLRHKKVSKKLKEFKSLANLVYLTPAAKMRLISFVDGVLQDRPYVQQCDSMIDLMAQKNAQIQRYSEAFWKVHRRSLRFYVAEVLWMLLTIPLFAIFIATWMYYGFLAGMGVFVLGGCVIAFGEMAMMTRQIRDMKAKKLTPSLISSLVAIRHNMCAETVNSDERTYEYEQKFKATEKRFMLTVTEVEAVKLAKENVSDKVTGRLSTPMQNLRQNKEAQAQIYYEKFNKYRRACLRYGALEVFVILLAIPLVTAVLFAFAHIGLALVELPLIIVGLAVAIAVEALALRNHIRVARRKELYLLIYQKMAVLLSNYKLFTDPVYIGTELHKLENSVIRAAEIDNMQDIAEHVSSVAVVDLSGNQLGDTYKDYQTKKKIGVASQDTAQFQGSLTALQSDFAVLGASDPKAARLAEERAAQERKTDYVIAN